MTIRYAQHVNRKQTPQSEPIPGESQVQNSAGGYTYETDKWNRLQRFLILGTDGGTYYAKEKALTAQNATVVSACAADDAVRTVDMIVAVSDGGRAPKNDPAVLALSIVASDPSIVTRSLAYAALPKVCRIPTHLFHFLAFVKGQRGWSRGLRNAVAKWYVARGDRLAYDLVKYQSRDGWANSDAFRLSHVKVSAEQKATLRWATGSTLDSMTTVRKNRTEPRAYTAAGPLPGVIAAFEEAKTCEKTRLIDLIREHNLSREMVPTSALNDRDVWAVLFERMPMEAMVRNLGKMTNVGLLDPMSSYAKMAADLIVNTERLRKARLHPLAILNAMRVYAAGHGDKGSLTWQPVQQIVDALSEAFYLSFGLVEPTGKRILLALDVSGSMSSGIAGTGLSCREAAAALALVTANVESNYTIVGFTSGSYGGTFTSPGGRTMWGRGNDGISPLAISPKQRLDTVVQYMAGLSFGGTDCALPMLYASARNLDVDAFVVITDNETWAGQVHPSQALRQYRSQKIGDAKLVVQALTPTEFTIADPNDAGMLDVVGFDLATPQAVAEFIRG